MSFFPTCNSVESHRKVLRLIWFAWFSFTGALLYLAPGSWEQPREDADGCGLFFGGGTLLSKGIFPFRGGLKIRGADEACFLHMCVMDTYTTKPGVCPHEILEENTGGFWISVCPRPDPS